MWHHTSTCTCIQRTIRVSSVTIASSLREWDQGSKPGHVRCKTLKVPPKTQNLLYNFILHNNTKHIFHI